MGVLSHYPALIQRIGKADSPFNLWMAQWVYTVAKKTSWADVISNIIPKIDMRVLTPGNATWQLLQWCASLELPGCNGAIDLSFYKGEKWRLGQFLGYIYDTTPEPPQPPTDQNPPADTVDLAPILARLDAAEARLAALEAFRANVKGA